MRRDAAGSSASVSTSARAEAGLWAVSSTIVGSPDRTSTLPGKQARDHNAAGACGEEPADPARPHVEAIVREQHQLRERRRADEVDQGHHQRDVSEHRMA